MNAPKDKPCEVLDLPLPPGWDLTAMQRKAVGAIACGVEPRKAMAAAGYNDE